MFTFCPWCREAAVLTCVCRADLALPCLRRIFSRNYQNYHVIIISITALELHNSDSVTRRFCRADLAVPCSRRGATLTVVVHRAKWGARPGRRPPLQQQPAESLTRSCGSIVTAKWLSLSDSVGASRAGSGPTVPTLQVVDSEPTRTLCADRSDRDGAAGRKGRVRQRRTLVSRATPCPSRLASRA